LVGLSIQPAGPAAVLTTTVLKKVRLPELFAEHQRQIRESHEFLTGAGPDRVKVTLGERELAPADAARFLNSRSSVERRTGRPTHWTPVKLAAVAQVYREAWIARKHPTKAVASRFHLSASGAAKVVKLARADGLLPRTTKGKPGWIEPATMRIARHSKRRKS
jgi:hypothetical protein